MSGYRDPARFVPRRRSKLCRPSDRNLGPVSFQGPGQRPERAARCVPLVYARELKSSQQQGVRTETFTAAAQGGMAIREGGR